MITPSTTILHLNCGIYVHNLKRYYLATVLNHRRVITSKVALTDGNGLHRDNRKLKRRSPIRPIGSLYRSTVALSASPPRSPPSVSNVRIDRLNNLSDQCEGTSAIEISFRNHVRVLRIGRADDFGICRNTARTSAR